MEQAIRKAEALPAVQQAHFEPVVLLVPALYIVALWLHAADGENDLVVPLPPAPGEFRTLEPLAAKDFLSATKRLAERVPPESGRSDDSSGG
jgi:hypothetical protein